MYLTPQKFKDFTQDSNFKSLPDTYLTDMLILGESKLEEAVVKAGKTLSELEDPAGSGNLPRKLELGILIWTEYFCLINSNRGAEGFSGENLGNYSYQKFDGAKVIEPDISFLVGQVTQTSTSKYQVKVGGMFF